MVRGNIRKMDNFHFIDVKSSIDRAETASIKEAIFRRAREKSNTLATEKNENYSTQVQNDVMEIARESITESPMNPFNQFMENMGLNAKNVANNIQSQNVANSAPVQQEAKVSQTTPNLEEIYTKEVKRNIESVSNKTFVNSVKDETMTAARNQFRQGTNLMATLNFLNTQAAIRMAESAHSKINYIS